MFLSNDFYNFLYIAVIILSGITFSLTLILSAREKDEKHRALYLFTGAVFVFMIIDFTVYYYLDGSASGRIVFAMITISDIMFCAVVTAWVYLLVVQSDMQQKIPMKLVILISVVYEISSQILSITLGRFDSFMLHVQSGTGKVVLQILNISYDLTIIAIGIICMAALFRKFRKNVGRTVTLALSAILIGYMLWIIYWDYSVWFELENNLMSVYAMDPIILIAAVFSCALIYYFYKKDPLRLGEKQIASVDAIAVISEKYGLSQREREVIELLNSGLSNPQIAEKLFISENTVKRHINSIFKKTGTANRHEVLFRIANTDKLDI